MTSTAVPPSQQRQNMLSQVLRRTAPGGQQSYNQRQPTALPANSSNQLPQTGLQQQVSGIQQAGQGLVAPMPTTVPGTASAALRPGQTNLNDIATNLARNYGIQLGATPLVDEQGNFLRMPSSGSEAVGFQFISQAIADEQNRRQQKKAEAALQQGVGMLQSRGRGSLAAVQSGQFEALAGLYSSQQFRAGDFSYFIQKEQLDRQEALIARQEKLMKKQKKGSLIGSIAGGLIGGFLLPGIGAAAGASIGGAIGGGGASTGLF